MNYQHFGLNNSLQLLVSFISLLAIIADRRLLEARAMIARQVNAFADFGPLMTGG